MLRCSGVRYFAVMTVGRRVFCGKHYHTVHDDEMCAGERRRGLGGLRAMSKTDTTLARIKKKTRLSPGTCILYIYAVIIYRHDMPTVHTLSRYTHVYLGSSYTIILCNILYILLL